MAQTINESPPVSKERFRDLVAGYYDARQRLARFMQEPANRGMVYPIMMLEWEASEQATKLLGEGLAEDQWTAFSAGECVLVNVKDDNEGWARLYKAPRKAVEMAPEGACACMVELNAHEIIDSHRHLRHLSRTSWALISFAATIAVFRQALSLTESSCLGRRGSGVKTRLERPRRG